MGHVYSYNIQPFWMQIDENVSQYETTELFVTRGFSITHNLASDLAYEPSPSFLPKQKSEQCGNAGTGRCEDRRRGTVSSMIQK